MQINVAQLLKAEVGATRKHRIESELESDGVRYPIHGEVTLTNIGKKVLVQGTAHALSNLNCGRCLKSFKVNLLLKIEEEYYPTIDINTGVKLEKPIDFDAFKIDEHHILDLSEAIRQYMLLALPMKPLCQANCAGMCPVCGSDLNEARCSCPTETIDSRWTELLKLKKNNRVDISRKRGQKGRE